MIILPSGEDKDYPTVDLDLHLPFFCFRPPQLLQVLFSTHLCFCIALVVCFCCVLLFLSLGPVMSAPCVVLFSADWARLTLVAESFLLFLQVCFLQSGITK